MIKIGKEHFAAGSKVYAVGRDGLTAAVRAILQAQAKIAASAVTALTDNSGGAAANGTIEVVGNFTPAAVGATDAAQKAELEAGLAAAVDALKELIAQANALHAKVPALDAVLTDNLTGTAADGTIGAVDVSYTGVGTSMAAAAGARAVVSNFTSRLAQLRYHVNKLAVACGVTPVADALGVDPVFSTIFADMSTGTGTAASGADAGANAIIKATDAGAIMQKVANAVKELALILNTCRSATGGTLSAVAA